MNPMVARPVAQMVRGLLPETPALLPEVRTGVEEDVVDFVVAQLSGMPTHVRIPYSAVVVVFDLLAIFRYGRRFAALSQERRRQYVESWAASSIPLVRDIVKPVRSCALLQYFDHPHVLEQLEAASPAAGGRGQ